MDGDQFKEAQISYEVDRSRFRQKWNWGLAFKTITAFGPNAAKHHHYGTKGQLITDKNLLLIDSGGQYLDGTTR